MEEVAVEAPVPALASTDPVQLGDEVLLTLVDGQQLRGVVVASDPGGLLLRIQRDGEGGMVHVATTVIQFIEPAQSSDSRFAFTDPNTTRYFYAPSAFSLAHGVGYVSQKEVVATTVAYGLVDGVGIEAGTVLPLLFTPARAAIIGLKLGFPVADGVHVGGGVQTLLLYPDRQSGLGALGLGFVVVTLGRPDQHVSVGVGQSAVSFDQTFEVGPTPVVIAVNLRLSDALAFVTESWLFVDPKQTLFPSTFRFFPSAGVRFLGRRFAADLGVVPIWIGDGDVPLIPIPWLDVTWNFRTRYADG